MKVKCKKRGALAVLGCFVCCLVLVLGMHLLGTEAAAAEETEALAPTIVSVGGKAIGSSEIGNFPSAIVNKEYKDADGNNYKIIATGSGKLTYFAREYETEGYGRMPEGLHLDPATGEFYGTITTAGTFGVSITVSNEYGSANVLCYISVYTESDKPVITTESLPNGAVGSSYYQTIEVGGLYSSYTSCEVIAGAVPSGLTCGMNNWSPTVYGTPTQAGSYTFTVSIYNGVDTATKEYTIEIFEETVKPELIKSATIVNESDKYSFINSSGYINVIQGKPVNIQLVASGTNTADNPIKYSLVGTLPDGLTLSEDGVISGTPADSIETSYGNKYFYSIKMKLENKSALGETQSVDRYIDIVVRENGYIQNLKISPSETSVPKGGTRQFELEWTGYGDYDTTGVTWIIANGKTASTISDTGLLTVGIDETKTILYVKAIHASSSRTAQAIITIVDHTHTTELVNAVDKTCTEDGNIAHYKCTACDELFEDALATKTLSADKVILPASHEYGTLIGKVPATCSSTGKEAYYECSACHTLFTSAKVETTDDALVIAIDETAHKLGTWKNEVSANCAEEGTKAHKTCEYCHKHFDSDGTEITDLTIAKNDHHLAGTVWKKDASGHWHACTREGCKDGGKVDFAEHTPSATEATETTNIHCTVCKYIIEAVKDHVHTPKPVAGYASACYRDGAKTYWVCAEGEHPCGKFFADAEGNTEITENIDAWKLIPASHTFGEWINETLPTCGTTGELAHKTCSVCHDSFDADGKKISNTVIEKNDDHTVTDAEALVSDQYGHWHVCTRAGCKSGGKVDYVEHIKSATEATETADIHCTVCGFVIEPTVGHAHELSKVAGYAETCTADGARTYWVCAGGEHPCNKYFEDADGETEITASRLNAYKTIPAHHTFGEWIDEVPATDDTDGVKAHRTCTACNKHFDAEGNEIETVTTDRLTPSDGDTSAPPDGGGTDEPITSDEPDEPKAALSGGAIAGIAVGGTAVAGIGGFSIFWFVIKKKKWADLILLFRSVFQKK